MAVLCVGFSFTLNMERFPNFAHIHLANFGGLVAFTAVWFLRLTPYEAFPIAVTASALLGAGLYLGVARPLVRQGKGAVTLTIAFLAASLMMNSVYMVIRYWLVLLGGVRDASFRLSPYDWRVLGLPVSWLFVPLSSVALVMGLHLFLHRTRAGISLRAVSEDEDLASTLGVDTRRAHIASWAIVGALTGFAGFSYALLSGLNPFGADALLVTVMAGSFIGGVTSVMGAAVGGFIIVAVQSLLVNSIGVWLSNHPVSGIINSSQVLSLLGLLPYAVIWAILLAEPEGLAALLRRLRESRLLGKIRQV